MKGTTFSKLFISLWIGLAVALIIMTTWMLSKPYYVQTNPAKVASDEIKAAMKKMGPRYDYRLLEDGTLQVDRGDGKWLKLKYERSDNMTETISESRPKAAYGLYITIDSATEKMILSTSEADADKCVEVVVNYRGTIKEYTLAEFLKKLGLKGEE